MFDRQSNARRAFLRQTATVAAGLATVPWWARASRAEEPEPTEAGRWELGCFTRPFAQFSFAETLDAIAEAGYQSVGLMSVRLPDGAISLADASDAQAARIRQMADERGLTISATYYGGPPVNRSLQAGIAGLRRLIDNCAAAGCASILMGGTGNEALQEAYYQAVAQSCDDAVEKGVALTLKPHGGLNATGPQCRQAIESVGHPAFRLWYDPGNIFYYSQGQLDPVEDAATVDGLVTGMCVKDFQPPQEVALNPGTGKVDFPGVMARLKAGGFTGGPLVVETLAPGDLKQTTANARAAREFLEELVQ